MVQQAFARRASRNSSSQNKAWFERLTAQGKAKPGRALQRTGVTVSGKNGRFVMDGPFAESKEAIGGYLRWMSKRSKKLLPLHRVARAWLMAVQSKCGQWLTECPLDVRARELAREEQLVNA
jgi:hypothetical protein